MDAVQGIWYENRFDEAADDSVFAEYGSAPEARQKAAPAGMILRERYIYIYRTFILEAKNEDKGIFSFVARVQ
jgi:hypothetical protein